MDALPAPHVEPEGTDRPELGTEHEGPALSAGRLIQSVGADLDVTALEEEVRAEVERKLRDGVYPAELLRDVAPDQVREMVDALRGAAHLSVDPPIRSTRPLLGRAVALSKLLLAQLLRWYSRWLVGQMQTLGSSTVSALGAMEQRLREHEQRLDQLSVRAAVEEGFHLGMPRLPGSGSRDAGSREQAGQTLSGAGWGAAWRWAVFGRALGATPGPIAVLGCGAGDFLGLLQAAGAECYGVEPHAERAQRGCDRGLTVRHEPVLAHLASVPGGTLGGVLVERLPEDLSHSGLAELFRLAAAALAPEGVLIVETDAGSAFRPPQSTASLEHAPLTFFAVNAGFSDVQVCELSTGPEESRLHPVPVPTGSTLGEVIGALNDNLQRMDDALFGPRLRAVVAHR